MSGNIKLVIAKFIAQEGKGEELFAAIERCIAPSRAEEGCIHYDVYKNTEDENIFLIHEKWKGEPAIQFHFEQTHFKRLLADTDPLLAAVPDIKSIDL
ncbi:putative quinol monooxygenase [Pantoea phytobeneficialis]|uniref:Drug:proton antiporter n=1 Tax=Pantoea phytobeneficialis TaxID=2052056 RepID=A0AAP9HAS2_9GAMM|nr:putative quinol monooxygenase [Pantoea phytobeneficialis]MDO6406571.1 putative quinol monooxygenase [Pantoea phytobeneficialis]QGR09664.1 drug:proton antiporter [Pantoea phytobeneficialis]